MRDGTSSAKTNKMKSSITPRDRVSYGADLNEENRPGLAVYLQLGRVMTDKTFLYSFISPPASPSAVPLILPLYCPVKNTSDDQLENSKI